VRERERERESERCWWGGRSEGECRVFGLDLEELAGDVPRAGILDLVGVWLRRVSCEVVVVGLDGEEEREGKGRMKWEEVRSRQGDMNSMRRVWSRRDVLHFLWVRGLHVAKSRARFHVIHCTSAFHFHHIPSHFHFDFHLINPEYLLYLTATWEVDPISGRK
jgi:hypothetical protein